MRAGTVRRGMVAALAAVALGSLVACSSAATEEPEEPQGGGSASADVDEDVRALVPEDIVSTGTLRIGNSGNYPPMEYVDEETGEYTGFDVELGAAIAGVFGLEYTIDNMPTFDQIINSLVTDRIDISITAMNDTLERQARLDFVDYLNTGTLVYTLADSSITELEDLCGSTVAMAKATTYADEVSALSESICADDPITLLEVEGTPNARVQLVQGRADAAVAAPEVFALVDAEEPDTFRTLEPPIATAPMGIGIHKDDPELRDAVFAAVQVLMERGVYDELVEKWGLESARLDEPTINAGS